ncbi:ATP-binding protein [Rhodopseudomonas palustris]|nr:ATP-binding protein [Rhodopseudomonas palustris]
MKVINLWAGPGAGKSTTAAGLFFKMKCAGYKVELVTEYAKDLTYERQWSLRRCQMHVSREQARRQRRLLNQVDYCITDSPLLLGLHYARPHDLSKVRRFVEQQWSLYDNVNFYINRVKPYQSYGRSGDEKGAWVIDRALRVLLDENNISYCRLDGDEQAPNRILDFLKHSGHLD